MGIYDDIKNFNKQFEYDPVIENAKKLALSKVKGFVVAPVSIGNPPAPAASAAATPTPTTKKP